MQFTRRRILVYHFHYNFDLWNLLGVFHLFKFMRSEFVHTRAKCEIRMIIQVTNHDNLVFWPVCTQISITKVNFNCAIGDFRNVLVFKFHAYSVNKRLFLTAKLARGLPNVATTNVCKVDISNRKHIERSRWMKWLITGLRQKKYPLIWIHYESPLFKWWSGGFPEMHFSDYAAKSLYECLDF